MTQCQKIVEYIKKFGSITSYDAFVDIGCTRLASRINDLKKEGVKIDSKMETGKNRLGESVSYKRYFLRDETFIYEVKTHSTDKPFHVSTAYRRQAQVEKYATGKRLKLVSYGLEGE